MSFEGCREAGCGRITGLCSVLAQPAPIRHGEHRQIELHEQEGRHGSHPKCIHLRWCMRTAFGSPRHNMALSLLDASTAAATADSLLHPGWQAAEALFGGSTTAGKGGRAARPRGLCAVAACCAAARASPAAMPAPQTPLSSTAPVRSCSQVSTYL